MMMAVYPAAPTDVATSSRAAAAVMVSSCSPVAIGGTPARGCRGCCGVGTPPAGVPTARRGLGPATQGLGLTAATLLGACMVLFRSASSQRVRRRRHGGARFGVVAVASAAEEQELGVALQKLKDTDFFSLFRINLFGPCTLLCEPEEECDMRCEVEPILGAPEWLEERDPEDFSYELDGWSRFDPPSEQAEYYSITQYPEANTGYDGSKIWKFIHSKLSFPDGVGGADAALNAGISALHTSIHAHIIEDIGNKEGHDAAKAAFSKRLGDRPEAIAGLCEARGWVLAAVGTAAPALLAHDYGEDAGQVLPVVRKLCESPLVSAASGPAAPADSASHRQRLRELCTVMDCVQCNTCRMHGKIGALGLGTTFKALWGTPAEQKSFTRVEVAGLIAFLEKLTGAISTLKAF